MANRPWTVPSSPGGPCSMGKTTSGRNARKALTTSRSSSITAHLVVPGSKGGSDASGG